MGCRPIGSFDAMGCREGAKCAGLDVVDGRALIGEGSSTSLPRAHLLCLERGVNGEPNPPVLGEDPLAARTRA